MRTFAAVLAVMLAVGLMAQVCLAQEDDGPPDRPPRDGARRGRPDAGPGGPGGGFRRPGGQDGRFPGGPGGQGGPGGMDRRQMQRPPHPLLLVFDTNHDGVISADEIAKASEALKKLDRNKDGKIDRIELRPPRPPRGGQDGQPDGGRRIRRPGGNQDGAGEGDRRPRRPGGPDGGGDQTDQPRRGPDPARIVQLLMSFDKNEDGKISKDELPERMQRIFDRADTDKSGALDEPEVKAFAERMAGGRPDAGPGGPRPPRDGAGPRRPRGPQDGDPVNPPRRRRPAEEK